MIAVVESSHVSLLLQADDGKLFGNFTLKYAFSTHEMKWINKSEFVEFFIIL